MCPQAEQKPALAPPAGDGPPQQTGGLPAPSLQPPLSLPALPKPGDVLPKPSDLLPKPGDLLPKLSDLVPKPRDLIPKPSDLIPRELMPKAIVSEVRSEAQGAFESFTGLPFDVVRRPSRLLPELRGMARTALHEGREIPLGDGVVGYRDGFYGRFDLPGGEFLFDKKGGPRGHWTSTGEDGVLDIRGDRRALSFAGATDASAFLVSVPTAGAMHGNVVPSLVRFRTEGLGVDWTPRRLDAWLESGPFSAEIHGRDYRVQYLGDHTYVNINNRTSTLMYGDPTMSFVGVLDSQHPLYGRADLWLDRVGGVSIANSPDTGLFVRTDLASERARLSAAYSRDGTFAGLTIVSPADQAAFAATYRRTGPGEEALSLGLVAPPGGFRFTTGRTGGEHFINGEATFRLDDRDRFGITASGGIFNHQPTAGIGLEYQCPWLRTNLGFEQRGADSYSAFLRLIAQW